MPHRLDLRSSKKHVDPENLSIYYTWKNRRWQSKNNKLKIIAPIWNGDFVSPEAPYLVSDIPNYIEQIVEKNKALRTNSLIHIYINRIDKRYASKIKYGYDFDLKTPETIKFFGSIKN